MCRFSSKNDVYIDISMMDWPQVLLFLFFLRDSNLYTFAAWE